MTGEESDANSSLVALLRGITLAPVTGRQRRLRRMRRTHDRTSPPGRHFDARGQAGTDRELAWRDPPTALRVARPAARHRPQTYFRLAAVSMRSRSAVVAGSHGLPGSCAQTRMTPSSITAHVAQPVWQPDLQTTPGPGCGAHAQGQAERRARSRREAKPRRLTRLGHPRHFPFGLQIPPFHWPSGARSRRKPTLCRTQFSAES